MTQVFNNIKEAKEYFAHYNFNNWLADTFRINTNEESINKVDLFIQAGIVSMHTIDKYGHCRPSRTFGVENYIDLINIIKEVVYDPYS